MYVISYDIERDKTRNKIAKTLEGYGKRVQYSVFECNISQDRYNILYAKLARLMENEAVGNIRFYNICHNCEVKIATIGVRDDLLSMDDQGFIIL